jgi:hypothetical protein
MIYFSYCLSSCDDVLFVMTGFSSGMESVSFNVFDFFCEYGYSIESLALDFLN